MTHLLTTTIMIRLWNLITTATWRATVGPRYLLLFDEFTTGYSISLQKNNLNIIHVKKFRHVTNSISSSISTSMHGDQPWTNKSAIHLITISNFGFSQLSCPPMLNEFKISFFSSLRCSCNHLLRSITCLVVLWRASEILLNNSISSASTPDMLRLSLLVCCLQPGYKASRPHSPYCSLSSGLIPKSCGQLPAIALS